MDQPSPTSSSLDLRAASIGNAASAIMTLARIHGITDEAQPIDVFATAASRLSDAEAPPDRLERLLVNLQRAGVLADHERFALHAAYLQQAGTPTSGQPGDRRSELDMQQMRRAPVHDAVAPPATGDLTTERLAVAARTSLTSRRASGEIMTYHLDGWVVREYPGGRIVRLAPITMFRLDDFPLDP